MNLPLKSKLFASLLLLGTLLLGGCRVSYSFSGASIPPLAKTASVQSFNNMAALVSVRLAPTLTDELTARIARETRLQLVRDEGDFSFSGEITDYRSAPSSISAGEYAQRNRLTITVKVRCVNKLEPKNSFDRTFTQYADYDSNVLLTTAENTLIPQIVEKLVEDIFNAAFSNW